MVEPLSKLEFYAECSDRWDMSMQEVIKLDIDFHIYDHYLAIVEDEYNAINNEIESLDTQAMEYIRKKHIKK